MRGRLSARAKIYHWLLQAAWSTEPSLEFFSDGPGYTHTDGSVRGNALATKRWKRRGLLGSQARRAPRLRLLSACDIAAGSYCVGLLIFFLSLQTGSLAESVVPAAANVSPSPVTVNPPNGAGRGQLQEVTVTGYITPRVGDGPQPVRILDQDFIQKQGDQTVADVLLRLPENLNSFTPQYNAGETYSAGASDANLRGLGADATLVLVDGQRQAAFPFPQNQTISFVDLNAIPLAAVDRIEILKDGASATYGSDAIAGVINIILKDSYQGADLKFYYGISQRGDYEQYHASLVGGISQPLSESSRLSILATFDYYEQGPINVEDRGYASQLNHTVYGPYLNWQSPSYSNPVFIDTRGNTYTVKPGTTGSITKNDFFYPDPVTLPGSNAVVDDFQLEPREERLGTYVKLNYQPYDSLNFHEEFSDQRNKESSQVNPYGAVESDNLIVPTNNPFNPFGIPLTIERARLDEFGPLKTYTTIDTVRTLTGTTLLLPGSWSVDASFLYSESDADGREIDNANKGRLQQALDGTLPGFIGLFYNPFPDQSAMANPKGSLVDAIRATVQRNALSSLLSSGIKAGGVLIDLPGGQVTAGLGIEYRNERYSSSWDANSASGNIVHLPPQSPASGSYSVWSGYAEVAIPILGEHWSWPGARLLEVDLQERYDDYSDFGKAAKPKFLLRYKPFDDLTFRFTYSEGYRAPSLSQLFSGTLYSFASIFDPKNPQLGAEYYTLRLSGNPELQPETAYSYYAGAVWSPGSQDPEHSWWGWANGLSAYLDWFQILRHNDIAALDPQQIVDNERQFPSLVVRQSNGQIEYVNDPFLNLGSVLVDGIDFGFSYSSREYPWGKIEFDVACSYQYNYAVQNIKSTSASLPGFGSIRVQPTGVYPENDSYGRPDFKMVASLFYSKELFGVDRFRIGLTLNYIDSEHDYLDNYKGTDPTATVEPNGTVHLVGSWTTLDLQVSYSFGCLDELTPTATHPEYSPVGKHLLGENAILPRPMGGTGGIRTWLDNATVTVGINNLGDNKPPFSDTMFGYDETSANPVGRYFYVELEKKF